jgi:hypothetical protein
LGNFDEAMLLCVLLFGTHISKLGLFGTSE